MSRPSRHTLRLLADELAWNWTQATIEDLFEDADIQLGPPEAAEGAGGVRRSTMAQYMASLDLDQPAHQAAIYRVFNRVLDTLAERGPDAAEARDKLVRSLGRDGVHVDPETGQIPAAARRLRLPEHALSALPDASAIRENLARMDASVDTDPRLAVSVAKDLVESTAKLVLRARGLDYGRNDDLPKLVAQAQEALALSAAKVPTGNPESKSLKTILGSLASLTQGIAELRNQVGVGHGRESVPTWVGPRHARLAAGAAHVWCQLMLETLDDPAAAWRRGA